MVPLFVAARMQGNVESLPAAGSLIKNASVTSPRKQKELMNYTENPPSCAARQSVVASMDKKRQEIKDE